MTYIRRSAPPTLNVNVVIFTTRYPHINALHVSFAYMTSYQLTVMKRDRDLPHDI